MREPRVFVQGRYFVWIACMAWRVVRGLDHTQSQENRRTPVVTATVRLNHASFRAACAAFSIPENLLGEGFDGIGCRESFLFQSLGCFNAVGVVGFGCGGLFL